MTALNHSQLYPEVGPVAPTSHGVPGLALLREVGEVLAESFVTPLVHAFRAAPLRRDLAPLGLATLADIGFGDGAAALPPRR